MASSFNHSTPGLVAGTSRTLVIGPIVTGMTAIVFDGSASNIDSTGMAQHWFTLESYDGVSTYTTHLFEIPLPFGSSSRLPRIALLPGESLYVTADAASSIAFRVEVLQRS